MAETTLADMKLTKLIRKLVADKRTRPEDSVEPAPRDGVPAPVQETPASSGR